MSTKKAAGSSGLLVSERIHDAFRECGFSVMPYADSIYFSIRREKNGANTGYVLENVPYTSIYGGTRGRSDYLILIGRREIRVDVKVQSTTGSIGEKYPYMLLNAIYAYHEKEVILLIESPGYQLGARQWLTDKVRDNWLDFRGMGKKIYVMNTEEFIDWLREQSGGNASWMPWASEEERLASFRTLPPSVFGKEDMDPEEYDAFLQRLAKDPNAE